MIALKRYPLLVVVMIVGLLVTACAGTTPQDSAGPGSGPASGDGGGEPTVLRVALPADIQGLNPAQVFDATTSYGPLRNIYDPLFFMDREQKPIPWLATGYKLIDDLTWEISLREGVRFHNGEPFNAEAVKFTFDYIMHPANNSQLLPYIEAVESVEVVDEYTVRIKTSRPEPTLPLNLNIIYIIPPEYTREHGADHLAANPVGTGAFKFVEWVPGERLVLEANPDYFMGSPAVDRVEFRPIAEPSSRMAAVVSGEVDLALSIPPQFVPEIEAAGRKVVSVPGRRVVLIALDQINEGPMQDVRVRQAINHAVDVDLIIDQILGGFATRMPGPLPVVNAHYVDIEPYAYDPERARQLLAEAGYADGLKLTLHTPEGRYLNDREVAEAVANQLRKVGIDVEVQVHEWVNFLEKVRAYEAGDMHLIGRSDRFFDGGIMVDWFACGKTYVTYCDEALDQRLFEAASIIDPEERAAAMAELQRVIQEQAPWLFLYQQHDVYALSESLQWEPRVDEMLTLWEAKLER